MAEQLAGNMRKVYDYLVRMSPEWVTNSQIEQATGVHPHQQVFQITQKLIGRNWIRGDQGRFREGEWAFSYDPNLPIPPARRLEDQSLVRPADLPNPRNPEEEPKLTAREFERLAERVMSQHFGKQLRKGTLPNVPKDFDLVSEDGSIVGDAKYFTLVGGKRLPSAKFSVIAEHVWLLGETQAGGKFLVFGNQREVPVWWLNKYGHLVDQVEFYFLTDDGTLEKLN